MTFLFDLGPRRKPRVLMHVIDAGEGRDGLTMAQFECIKCGYESEWVHLLMSQAKRGLPCPNCNPKEAK